MVHGLARVPLANPAIQHIMEDQDRPMPACDGLFDVGFGRAGIVIVIGGFKGVQQLAVRADLARIIGSATHGARRQEVGPQHP